jgi:hypothetical protein
MEPKHNRREFIDQCAKIGCACGALLVWGGRLRAEEQENPEAKNTREKKLVDLKQLSYCGIPCGSQVCELYRMTVENDVKTMQALYDQYPDVVKKEFGMEKYDPDKMSCHTCKPVDKSLRFGMDKCLSRNCAMDNGLESCVQCKNLATCDMPTWKTMPHHYAFVKWTQARYMSQSGSVLVDANDKGGEKWK